MLFYCSEMTLDSSFYFSTFVCSFLSSSNNTYKYRTYEGRSGNKFGPTRVYFWFFE
jgi:hypothetical protein